MFNNTKDDDWGYCFHCLRKWNVVNGKTIDYQYDKNGSVIAGMFPICEECFDKLSVEEISNYIKVLVLGEFRKLDKNLTYEKAMFDINNAIESVKIMKQKR